MNNDTANHIAADAAATRATAGADEREARVLAVVLGEAPPAEIEAVEKLLAADPALRAWRDELVAATLPLLRDTLCATAARPADVTVPSLRLDDARREKLLVLLTQGIRGGICGAGVPPASGVARASSPCALPHRVARASSPWTALRAARLLRALVFRIPGKDAHARTRASGGKTPRHIADQSPVPWLALIRENRLLFTTCAALLFGIIGAAIAGVFTIRMRPGPVRPATAYLELVPSGRTADQSGATEDRLVSHAVSPAPAALAAAWGGGGGGPARETNAFAAAAPATMSLPKPSPVSRPVAMVGLTPASSIAVGTSPAPRASRLSDERSSTDKLPAIEFTFDQQTGPHDYVYRSATDGISPGLGAGAAPPEAAPAPLARRSFSDFSSNKIADTDLSGNSNPALTGGHAALKPFLAAESKSSPTRLMELQGTFDKLPTRRQADGEKPDSDQPQSRTQQLASKGRAQYLAGDLDGAQETFRHLETISGSDPAAKYFLRRITEQKASAGKADREATLALTMQTVTESWQRPGIAPSPPPPPVSRPVRPETLTLETPFSTFSLNVSDASFRLAAEALRRGQWPDSTRIRPEEFVNALAYNDPPPADGQAIALAQEQARHPFAHNRNLLRLSLQTASAGRSSRQPLNLTLLLDTSGSMERPDRQQTVSVALNALADALRPGDTVSLLGFALAPRLYIGGADGPAAAGELRRIARDGIPPEGGTNLETALDAACNQNRNTRSPASLNRVVLLTDGAANLGDANPETLAAIVEKNKKQGITLDCYGIGFDGYNDAMLETLARAAHGRYAWISNPDEARSGFAQKLAGALRVAAQNVKVQVEFNPARVVSYRLSGYEKHRLSREDFRDNTVAAAELGAAESGTAVYTFETRPDADGGAGDAGIVRVRYQDPATGDYHERAWNIPHDPAAPAFDQAAPGVQLAATAALLAEHLADTASPSPSASASASGGVPLAALAAGLRQALAAHGAFPANAQLLAMLEEAARLER